jgi:hypothetical protein
MKTDDLLSRIEVALQSITHPRFFETERGFQGQLVAALVNVVPVLMPAAVVEQEYQKRLELHGLRVRPDIIIHEPFDATRHTSRQDGNVAVIELKLNASAAAAKEDFSSLIAMMEALAYPAGVFVNIAANETHAASLPDEAKGRVACFAVWLDAEGVHAIRGEA